MGARTTQHDASPSASSQEPSCGDVQQIALEDSAGFRLSRLVRVRRERWANQLSTLGLTPSQAAILRATRDHRGQAMRALARTLNIDAMSAKRCVDELESRGWLATTTREDDRRVRVVDLTARGEELTSHLDELAHTQEWHLRSQLSPAHYELLVAVIATLERAEGIGAYDDVSKDDEQEEEQP